MHRKFFNAMYVFNIVIQSIISLVSPIAVGILIAWLLTEKAGVGGWIYVVLIILGVISGLFSMVRFTLPHGQRSLKATVHGVANSWT